MNLLKHAVKAVCMVYGIKLPTPAEREAAAREKARKKALQIVHAAQEKRRELDAALREAQGDQEWHELSNPNRPWPKDMTALEIAEAELSAPSRAAWEAAAREYAHKVRVLKANLELIDSAAKDLESHNAAALIKLKHLTRTLQLEGTS